MIRHTNARHFPLNAAVETFARWTNHDLSTARTNVVSGAEMVRRLQKMAPGAGIAEIATLYNKHDASKVSDHGARVAQLYKDKPWETLTKPATKKGSPQ